MKREIETIPYYKWKQQVKDLLTAMRLHPFSYRGKVYQLIAMRITNEKLLLGYGLGLTAADMVNWILECVKADHQASRINAIS